MVLCDISCSTMEEPEALEWYMNIGKDAARTSWAENATPMHILQRPGETLYVPNGYIHAVMNLDNTGNLLESCVSWFAWLWSLKMFCTLFELYAITPLTHLYLLCLLHFSRRDCKLWIVWKSTNSMGTNSA